MNPNKKLTAVVAAHHTDGAAGVQHEHFAVIQDIMFAVGDRECGRVPAGRRERVSSISVGSGSGRRAHDESCYHTQH